MKPNDLRTEEIKAALRRGHIVVTGSQTGKTHAIVELMRERAPIVVVVPDRHYGNQLAACYEAWYGERPSIEQIVVGSERLRFRDEIIIVEELQINPYRGPFWAATATFHNHITLLTSEKGALTNDTRTDHTVANLSAQTLPS